MGRKAGTLHRCTCVKCGAVELWGGCTAGFQCVTCKPVQARDSLKYQAHKAVQQAIRRGELRPARDFACVDCGGPAVEYDHRNYFQPLLVEPVCRRCNLRRGPAAGALPWRKRGPARFAAFTPFPAPTAIPPGGTSSLPGAASGPPA